MANHSYPVEVQSDFLEKITRVKPVQAPAEFSWNSLDADASKVDVLLEQNELGAMSRIIVRGNGTGMEFEKAPELFRSLGGSRKRSGATTKQKGRFLRGQDGRGRFKAFALGRISRRSTPSTSCTSRPPGCTWRTSSVCSSRRTGCWTPGTRCS